MMTTNTPENAEHETWPAVRNGLLCKCPNCGDAPMFEKYLKVVDKCGTCGEEMHHHRADDGPAYLTILIVCHLLIPYFHFGYIKMRLDPTLLAVGGIVMSVIVSLLLLPRMKGMVVAVQWAKRMHGFGRNS